MSTGGNKAQIDLVANAEALKPGIATGEKAVEDFSKAVVESMKDSEVSVEQLEKHFKSLVDELSQVVKASAESTNATLNNIDANNRSRAMLSNLLGTIKDNIVILGILTATVIKTSGSIADKTAKVKTLISSLATLKIGRAHV